MSPIHEQLSALMDGELERDAARFVLKRVAGERELGLAWARWHLAREAIRRQQPVVLADTFADAVMARIEGVGISPVRSGVPVWLRWGAGGAIAASVALAALVVTQPANEDPLQPVAIPQRGLAVQSPPSGPAINAAPVAATTAPREFRAPLMPVAPIEAAPASFGGNGAAPAAIDPHLEPYLIRHYQSVGRNGPSAFVPYVLLVTPQPEARQALPPAAANGH
jgi:sigma-E factor negative regulatory protein RseA